MGEDREPQGGATDDEDAGSDANDPDRRVSKTPPEPTEEEQAEKQSKDSFPASDPPAW